MEWIPGPLESRRRRRSHGSRPRAAEILEPRMLLADGISPMGGGVLTGTPGVALTNVVIASFTITDPSGAPGTKWNAEVVWGDNGAKLKRVAATPGPNGTFQFVATHTYAMAGNYTITVMIAVPGSHKPNDNVVTTKAMISAVPTLQSIVVTPSNTSVPVGLTSQFTATGDYSDGSHQNLTNQAIWASSNSAVATISNAAGSQGLATAHANGSSTISATFGGVTGSTQLTVNTASLVSISMSPLNPTIGKGATEQFTATGTFSDGSTQNVSSSVTWSSASTNVATISNTGLANGVSPGTATIRASLGAISTATTLTVNPAILVSLAVAPANPTIPLGTTQQFTAIATRSDSTTVDLTPQVTWSSSNTKVATITNTGLATALARGTTTIKATFQALSGSTLATVGPPTPAERHLVAAGVAFQARLRKTFDEYVAYFNEPNTKTQDFHAFIDWGDGSKTSRGHIHGRTSGGRFAVVGSHRYVKSGIFPIIVTIRDPAGTKIVANSTVHVLHP
jgi:hypothetical protein